MTDEPKRKVVVEVLGGVAYVTICPEDVDVEIKDWDNEEDSFDKTRVWQRIATTESKED